MNLAPCPKRSSPTLRHLPKIRHSLNCAGDALVIGSDTLLYRLVFNLVENAIRYSRPDSTVNVSICDNDSHVFLRVEDQGREYPGSTERASSSRSFV